MSPDDQNQATDLGRLDRERVANRSLITRRDLAFGGSLATVLLAAGYVRVLHPADAPLPLVGFWEPSLIDWMFAVSILVFGFYLLWPLLRRGSVLRRSWSELVDDRLALASLGWIVLFVAVGTFEPIIVDAIRFNPLHQPPVGFSLYEGYVGSCVGDVVAEQCHGSLAHPFGTDGNGRDVLLLTVAGTRTALQMTVITAAIILPLGIGVGTYAGYAGGRVDEILMRYVDTQQTLPALFIYIALAVIFGPSLSLMVVVFGLLNWGDVARLVRSEVLQVREAEFVTAARGAGITPWGVIRHHVIPNVTPAVLSITALKLPLLIIVEATLSYLNFADPRVVSWGNVVSVGVLSSQDPSIYWWVGGFPIGALVLTTLAISVFGNSLQDALDPRRSAGGSR